MLFSFLNAFLFLGFKGNPGVSVWPNASVHWWSHTTAPACLLPRGIPPEWGALYPVQSTGEHLSGFAQSSSRSLFTPIRRNCSRTIFNWHCWGMLHSHTQLTSAAHWVHTKVWNITDTILLSHSAASGCTCCATAVRANCTKASDCTEQGWVLEHSKPPEHLHQETQRVPEHCGWHPAEQSMWHRLWPHQSEVGI